MARARCLPGLTEIRSDTNLVDDRRAAPSPLARRDFAAVHKAAGPATELTPLSKWGTQYTPPASVPVKSGIDV